MLAYDGSHILHTAIAYFDVVLVETRSNIIIVSTGCLIYHLGKENNYQKCHRNRMISYRYRTVMVMSNQSREN